jgi:hypothetical protein
MPPEVISPTFKVQIGAKEFPLRYQHRDIAEAEARTGIPLIGVASLPMWNSGTSAHIAGVLLFAGLLHVLPNLTLETARAFITFDNAEYIETTVTDAFKAALPKRTKDDDQAAEEQPDAIPLPPSSPLSDTGSTSGPSPSSTSDSPSTPSGD